MQPEPRVKYCGTSFVDVEQMSYLVTDQRELGERRSPADAALTRVLPRPLVFTSWLLPGFGVFKQIKDK